MIGYAGHLLVIIGDGADLVGCRLESLRKILAMVHRRVNLLVIVRSGIGPEGGGHSGVVIGLSQQFVSLGAVVVGDPLVFGAGFRTGDERGKLLGRELLGCESGNGENERCGEDKSNALHGNLLACCRWYG